MKYYNEESNRTIPKSSLSKIERNFLISGYGKYLIPVSISSLEDEYILRYYLGGYISLNNLQYPTLKETLLIFKKILESIELGKQYILDIRKLDLNEETLYMKQKENSIKILFSPGKRETYQEKILKIMDILEKKTNQENLKNLKKIKREIIVYNLPIEEIIKAIDRELMEIEKS